MIAAALIRCSEAVTLAGKRIELVPLEARLTAKMRTAFTAQGKAVLAHFRPLERLFTRPTVLQEAIEEADWRAAYETAVLETLALFERPLSDMVTAALRLGIRSQLATIGEGISFDLANPLAVEYLSTHAAEAVAGINETTRASVGRILTQAADEGWSYSRAATAIKTKFDGYANGVPAKGIASRAKVIAVTELGNAYEQAGQMVGKKLIAAGIPLEKSQLVVSQPNVCPICLGNKAEGWIPFAQPFASGHTGPLIHPSCRCSLLIRRVGSG